MADRWLTQQVEPGLVHVIPRDDAVTHEESEDCVCGPRHELVTGPRGDGWVHVHHSLDGRELTEPDH